jgi:signal transduction histidine kinase
VKFIKRLSSKILVNLRPNVKKKGIYWIIGLMLVALCGIIVVQLIWIQSAMKIREELFDRSVNDALEQVVKKIETREAAGLLAQNLTEANKQDSSFANALTVPMPPTMKNSAKSLAFAKAMPPSFHAMDSIKYTPKKHKPFRDTSRHWAQRDPVSFFGRNQKIDPATIIDSMLRHDSLIFASQMEMLSHFDPAKIEKLMFENLKKLKVLQFEDLKSAFGFDAEFNFPQMEGQEISINFNFETISPGGVVVSKSFQGGTHQTYSNQRTMAFTFENNPVDGAREKGFIQPKTIVDVQRIKDTLNRVFVRQKKLLRQKAKTVENVIEKMVIEYNTQNLRLEERINFQGFDTLLRNELKQKGLGLTCEYSVMPNNVDTIATFRTLGYRSKSPLTIYRANLFPNDLYEKQACLNIQFPMRKSYILQSMSAMLGSSLFFTIVILLTFAMASIVMIRQKKMSDIKSDFINNMTHELKTPIATISLAIDSIRSPKVIDAKEKLLYFTNIIKEENKRMNKQVENVLQMALIDKKDFNLKLEEVDLHELILRAAENINLQIEKREGLLSLDLAATQTEVLADEVHLLNVITNLMDNANKYSPEKPEITVSTRDSSRGVIFTVADKGLGMSSEHLNKIFEKFYRVATGNIHNVKGFGLGLSYVKAIVLAHKGNISVKSQPGEGSEFEVFLPYPGK